jgi:drug/metabolite transporter (DMT)-like permease
MRTERQYSQATLSRKWKNVPNGILLALIAYASYSGSDAVIKSLGGQFTVFEIGFFSTLFAGCFLFFSRPAGERWRDFWRMKRPWAVQARALAGIASGVLSVYAFTHIPLAEVYALIFLAPLLVTILSTVILKEKVGPWRWLAVVAGFAGVMLVVRPGFRELNLGHLAAFVNAFLAAASVILLRSLAQQEKRTSMLGVLVGYGLLFNGAGAAASSFTLPNAVQLVWLAMAGAFTAGGQLMQLLAAKYAPANRIAPTHYSQIVWAVILGALFFQEYPDWLSLVGLAVVGASGLLTMVREEVRLGTVRWNPFSRTRL